MCSYTFLSGSYDKEFTLAVYFYYKCLKLPENEIEGATGKFHATSMLYVNHITFSLCCKCQTSLGK